MSHYLGGKEEEFKNLVGIKIMVVTHEISKVEVVGILFLLLPPYFFIGTPPFRSLHEC